MILKLNCDKASMVNIVKRSILIKYLLEYWANSSSSDLLVLKLKSYPISFYEKYRHSNFKFKFHCFGQTISQEEKLDKMEMLSFLPFEGRVKLNDPEQVFIWLEYYDEKSQTIDDYNAHLYFGRWLSNGLRAIASNFKLSDRKYIGNTSMDPKLSFLLTNIAQITATDLVLDPFVGSGSLILSAAYHEAYVSGIDIEKKMLYATGKSSRYGQKWKTKDENIWNNFKQYDLERYYLDVVLSDSTLPLFRNQLFDAIITDPPYGIRESCSKNFNQTGSDTLNSSSLDQEEYNLSYIYKSLLDIALNVLNPGGRLVFWLPFVMEDIKNYDSLNSDIISKIKKQILPFHHLFELENCDYHSIIGSRMGRFLVCMRKKILNVSDFSVYTKININELKFLDSTRDIYFNSHSCQ
ncbi:tRNA (guanine(10)-N2)-methyltransferase homolog isoform X2 [Gordionus sp. m RMFG-2023]|uniref:tRNA (guanine(10)-N2)-methyltransferase homolog isoform X2 n=1 Tax=Gordionus sp. m RMFG-2023 TaxID=3053472 RepID=UPI0031FBD3D3